jgi:catalase
MNAKLNSRFLKHQTTAIVLCAATAACATLAMAADAAHESPAQMVDALRSAFGKHHARAVHAKGIMLEGSFTPSPEAPGLTTAPHLSGPTIPVTVRFSDFTGIPNIPDNIDDANPRGLALKFRLADGSSTDIVSHSFNGFPTATSDEFAQLLRAIGASGANAAKPTALETFLGNHPIAKTFLTSQKPAPVSYATLAYFGVNSFKFTNQQNQSIYVRYRFVPKAGEQFLDAGSTKTKGPNYLAEEVSTRVAKTPILFDWLAQISSAGDVIDDPSIAWPESRKLVKLGTISITRMTPDLVTADKATMFSPGNLPRGIEPADPMVAVRRAAYPISFGERQ